MDNIRDFIKDKKHKVRQVINTRKIIIDTLKDEKIELLERIIKLKDNEDVYKVANKKLKARNKELAIQVKELKAKILEIEKEEECKN